MKKLAIILAILCFSSFTLYQDGTIPTKAEDISPLLVGERIPEVKLSDIEGKTVNLLETIKQKPSILIFYRGGWCPFCNKQLAGLQKIKKEFDELGYQIIAISPDDAAHLGKTVDKKSLDYQLFSDSSMEVAKQFGIAFQLEDNTVKKYEKYGINLNESSGGKNDQNLLPVPSVFVLDQRGTIKFEYINPNYKERLNGELLLFAAKLALKK